MMRYKVIISIMFVLLLIGGFLFVYFKYEKPQENIKYINVSIIAKDSVTGKAVKTGYLIYYNTTLIENKTTEKYSAILKQIPSGKYVIIKTYNINNQTYYESSVKFLTNSSFNPMRISFMLRPYGKIKVNYTKSNSEINFKIKSDGIIKNLTLCFDWTVHFIFVKVNNMSSIGNNCYNFGNFNDGEEKDFIIDYKTFGKLNNKDLINITFYHDNSKILGNYNINNI